MTWGRRTTGALAAAAVGVLLTGCGGGGAPSSGPTEVVIPGSTNTIGTEADGDPEPTDATGSTQPTDGPTTSVTTAEELFTQVGAAMGEHETVHVSVGDETAPTVEADVEYLGAGDDFVAEVLTDPSTPVEVRRVDGVLYAGDPGGAFEEVAADDELAAYRTWAVLADLAAVLQNADGFAADGPTDVDGVGVAGYTFTVDASALVSSTQVPDELTGPVGVTFSVDATGLPVRVDQAFEDGTFVRTDYSEWGVTVDVEAPEIS
jgi:hypothetical protein